MNDIKEDRQEWPKHRDELYCLLADLGIDKKCQTIPILQLCFWIRAAITGQNKGLSDLEIKRCCGVLNTRLTLWKNGNSKTEEVIGDMVRGIITISLNLLAITLRKRGFKNVDDIPDEVKS